jgi:LacI family transcriptional regulator
LYTRHHDNEDALYDDLVGGSADGVLVIGPNAGRSIETRLVRSGHPTVFVSFSPGQYQDVAVVDCDNRLGGEIAMRHLVERGHRHLAVVSSHLGHSFERERHEGALRVAPSLTLLHEKPPDSMFAELLELSPRPTGIFFSTSERIASEFVERALNLGYAIPGEFAVVSFDGTDHSIRAALPMTSVAQPLEQIGSTALDRLVERIANPALPIDLTYLPVRLDVRQTT